MNDFKLKVILSLLGGILFSFIFILLAFVLPVDKEQKQIIQKPKGRLGEISKAMRER